MPLVHCRCGFYTLARNISQKPTRCSYHVKLDISNVNILPGIHLNNQQTWVSGQSRFFDEVTLEVANAVGVLMHLRQQIPTPKPQPSITRAMKPSKILT